MHDLASLEGGLVGEDPGAGDVGRLHCVRVGVLAADDHVHELVGEVGMRSPVTRPLREGEVFLPIVSAVDAARGERGNLVGQIGRASCRERV